jgi:hypothetical protein
MTIDLKGPAPEKMKPGELYRVVRVKDKTYRLEKVQEAGIQPGEGEKHLTTIVGPQAEALLKANSQGTWINRSVPGLTVLEFWGIDPEDEYWG